MTTPLAKPSNGPRHSTRRAKQSRPNSRSVASENDADNTTGTNQHNVSGGENKSRQRKKSQAKRTNMKTDAAVYSDDQSTYATTQHHKVTATPMKQQAYAGPTFHQSPAPSTLPIPSFYSKSVPNAAPLNDVAATDTAQPGSVKPQVDGTEPTLREPTRESTPLDFLFEAARKAKATPGNESPQQRYYSPAAGSPLSRSPAPRDGESMFSLELDGADTTPNEDDRPFATPYRERMEALRSARPTSEGGRSLDDAERKAKTAALKQFLMNSAKGSEGHGDNPFNARPAPARNDGDLYYRQSKVRSNPTTPMHYNQGYNNQNQYFPPMPPMPNGFNYGSPMHKPPSNLRKVYEPGMTGQRNEDTTNESHHEQVTNINDQGVDNNHTRNAYVTPRTPKGQAQTTDRRATPNMQQLEDDLRRMLKLDLMG